MDDWLIFKEDIIHLSFLENLLNFYIDSEDEDADNNFNNIFENISKIGLMKDYLKYSAFLNLLANTSLSRPSNRNIYVKIQKIINELKQSYNLKTLFLPRVLFDIFYCNKIILLILLEEELIDINLLKREVKFHHKKDSSLFFFFYKEFEENDNNFVDDITKCLHKNTKFKPILSEKRKNGHSNEVILKIIQTDDIDEFIAYISQNDSNIDIILEPSIYEPSQFINSCKSLIDYAIIFGSIKIFKYLILNSNESNFAPNRKDIDQNAYYINCAILGNNPDIIHLIESNNQLCFNESCLIMAINFHRFEIFQYIIETLNLQDMQPFINASIFSFNFLSLSYILQKQNEKCFVKTLKRYEFLDYLNKPTLNLFINFLLQAGYIDTRSRTAVL